MNDYPAEIPQRGSSPLLIRGLSVDRGRGASKRFLSCCFSAPLSQEAVHSGQHCRPSTVDSLEASQFKLYGLPAVNQATMCDQGISRSPLLEHVSLASRFPNATT